MSQERTDDTGLQQRILDLLAEYDSLHDAALTSNPLINWDQLLLVRRTPHGDPAAPWDVDTASPSTWDIRGRVPSAIRESSSH